MGFSYSGSMSSTEGRYNLYSQGSTGWSILRNEEFQEHDIWGALHETKEISSNTSSNYIKESSTFTSSLRNHPPAAARMIPKSSNSSMNQFQKVQQSSAPLHIPDWPKIHGKKVPKTIVLWDSDEEEEEEVEEEEEEKEEQEEEEEDDDDASMMPPHEWIARKQARSGISSFSVHEGVGRTLKGRDLSNVRNAVLSRTGFLE